MRENFLQNIIVHDYTSRLPGPLASKNLADLGAKVFKIEQTDDPFNKNQKIKYFNDWYQQLNHHKSITKEHQQYNADIVIAHHEKQLENYPNACKILILAGQKEFKYLHDLNAISFSKTYKALLNNDPKLPELPFAGICFGQYISQVALSLYIAQEKQVKSLYLKNFTEYFFDLFYSHYIQQNKNILHKGAFPCYNLYATQDGNIICFAAMEDKFWSVFCELADLKLKLTDKYDTSGKVQTILSDYFKSITSQKLNKLLQGHHLCISVINKKG